MLADILSGDDDAPSPRWSMTELRASPRRQMPGSRALPRMALPESRAVCAPPSAPVLANIFDDESDAPSPRGSMAEVRASPRRQMPGSRVLPRIALPESRAVWAPPSAPVLANIFDDESDTPSPRRRMPESCAVPLNHPRPHHLAIISFTSTHCQSSSNLSPDRLWSQRSFSQRPPSYCSASC